jgi:ADP-ribose pyrophosphatase
MPSDKKVIHEGKFLKFINDGGWEYVERTRVSGVVAILAITDDRKLVLIEQFRKPIGKRVVELPAGLVGDAVGEERESVITAAKRELLEESGYQADEMVYLTQVTASAGLTSEAVHLYRGKGLAIVAQGGGDATEDITVHEIALGEIDQWLARKTEHGAMVDMKVYAALYFASKELSKPVVRELSKA